MRSLKGIRKLVLLLALLVATPAHAGSGITYQGRILRPDGSPLNGATVQFKMQLRTPGSESCLLFEEVQNADMRLSNGNFSLTINDGTGSRSSTPVADGAAPSVNLGLDRIFANRGGFTFPAGACASGTAYAPNPDDGRSLVVLFKDETMPTWEQMPLQKVNYVPFAFESKQIQGFTAASLMRVQEIDGTMGNVSPLSNAEFTKLRQLSQTTMTSGQVVGWNGTTWTSVDPLVGVSAFARAALPACAAGAYLRNNAGAFECTTPAVGGGGTVTQVNTGTGLTGGGFTTSGTISISAGGVTATELATDSVIAAKIQAGAVDSTKLAASAVTTAKLADGSVTNVKLADGSVDSVKLAADAVTSAKIADGTVTGADLANNITVNTSGTLTSRGLSLYPNPTGAFGVSFAAPAGLAANYTVTWPLVQASGTQVLQNDGTGALSWASLPAVTPSQWTTQAPGINYMTGNVGIGTTSAAALLDVEYGSTATSGFDSPAGWMITTPNPAAASSASYMGAIGALVLNGTNTSGATGAGVQGLLRATGSGSLNMGYGLLGVGQNLGTGSIASLAGVRAAVGNYSTGSVGSAYGMIVTAPGNSGGGTLTDYYGIYIQTPTAATTNYAFYSQGGTNYFGGRIGAGVLAPSANLHVKAGSAAAGSAPLKLNSGPVMTTPEAGAIEYDGTSLFYTDSTNTRRTLGVAGAGITALTGDVTATGAGSVAATVASVGGSTAANVNTATVATNLATDLSTINRIVKRDGTGSFAANQGTFNSLVLKDTGSSSIVLGAPATVSSYFLTLPPARATANNQVLASDTAGNTSWFTLPTALPPNGAAGGDLAGTYPNPTVATVGGSTAANINTATASANAATALNTSNTIVKRGAAGEFAAGVVTTNGVSLNNGGSLLNILNPIGGAWTLTLPSTAGSSGQVMQTNGSGVLTWATPSTGLVNFTESVNTAAPNATVPVVQLLATNAATNVDVALTPKGTGSFASQTADGTAAGGNKRGSNSVDLQTVRSSATQVASGTQSFIGSGSGNTASGGNSAVLGGLAGVASGVNSSVIGGSSNTASGTSSSTLGGVGNIASGWYANAGGFSVTADSYGQTTFGAYNMPKGSENPTTWVTTDPLFVIGNGTGSAASRSTALMVLKNGNVGIGTTAPNWLLEVAGSAGLQGQLAFTGTTAGSAANGIHQVATGQIAIRTNSAERVRIDSSGSVGIGTTAPSSILHAKGTSPSLTLEDTSSGGLFTYTQNTGAGAVLRANSPTGSSSIDLNPTVSDGASVSVVKLFRGTTTSGGRALQIFRGDNTPTIDAQISAGTNGTTFLNANGGNVGIGTTAPATKLEVAGTLRLGDGGETCGATYTGGVRYNGGNIQFCNGTSWSTLGVAGSGITALTGDVTASGTGSVAASVATVGGVTAANVATGANLANAATNVSTASAIVKRDASGNFLSNVATVNGLTLNNAGSLLNIVNPIGGAWTMTLPATAGSSGQVLSTNGAGVLSWAAAGGASQWTTTGSDIYYNTGVVGIGTTAPSATGYGFTNVSQTGTYLNALFKGNANDDVMVGIETKTGSGRPVLQFNQYGAFQWQIFVDGANKMFFNPGNSINSPSANSVVITPAGRIGIGTTSPGSALDLKGAIRLSGTTSGYSGFQVPAAAGSTVYTLPATAPTAGQVLSSNATGVMSWIAPSAGTPGGSTTQMQFNNAGAFAGASGLTWDSAANNLTLSYSGAQTGKFGIDTSYGTISPSGNTGGLQATGTSSSSGANYGVKSTATSSSGTSVNYGVYSSATTSNTSVLNGVYSLASNTGAGTVANAYAVQASVSNSGTITNGYGLYVGGVQATNPWSVYASDATAPSYFAGNVGIGTTAPASKLDIQNTSPTVTPLIVRGAVAQSANLFAVQDVFGNPQLQVAPNGTTSMGSVGLTGILSMNTLGTNYVMQVVGSDFKILNGNNGSIPFYANAAGNVGIGTTAPSQMLEVNGTIKATDIILTSDARAKHDIASLDSAAQLEKIFRVRPVSFSWNYSGKRDDGVIAQELRELYPEMVIQNPDGTLSVKYPSLIAPLISSVQELKKRNEELTERVLKLEKDRDRMTAIEKENQQLKADVAKILRSMASERGKK